MSSNTQQTGALTHEHHNTDSTDVLGFWLYILTDCILFATLFATYVVLHKNTFGRPSLKQLIELPYVLGETLFLLASSFTYGMAMLAMYKNKSNQVISWLMVTFLLGLGFVAMEINEFVMLISEGHGPSTSGAMTAFFTLVGTHGLHVSLGLLWMLVMIAQVYKFKTTSFIARRLTYLGLFWSFLDIVWIFVFTIVYLMGVIG